MNGGDVLRGGGVEDVQPAVRVHVLDQLVPYTSNPRSSFSGVDHQQSI